jgi:hypothetical protein
MLPTHSNLPSVTWNLKASSPSLPKANAWTGRALTDEVSEHVNEHLSAINEHQVRFKLIDMFHLLLFQRRSQRMNELR